MGNSRRVQRAAQKALRKAERKKYKKLRDQGACFHKGCTFNGDETFHCKTCEDLGKEKPYSIQTCYHHRVDAVAKIKSHALLKHPSNLLKATVATLTGKKMGEV